MMMRGRAARFGGDVHGERRGGVVGNDEIITAAAGTRLRAARERDCEVVGFCRPMGTRRY
jgi:hypothetical protein